MVGCSCILSLLASSTSEELTLSATLIDVWAIFENKLVLMALSGVAGFALNSLAFRLRARRGVLSYTTSHVKIGESTRDPLFGDVLVTWNGSQVQDLYLSTVELKNQSLNDYTDVVINTVAQGTLLLTESTQVNDTPQFLNHTEIFRNMIAVPEGQEPTQNQLDIHGGQREHLIPFFGRGSVIKFKYLNTARNQATPELYLSSNSLGIRIVARKPSQMIFGVEQKNAVIVGILIGLFMLVPASLYFLSSMHLAYAAFALGCLVIFPGIGVIKIYRWLRAILAG